MNIQDKIINGPPDIERMIPRPELRDVLLKYQEEIRRLKTYFVCQQCGIQTTLEQSIGKRECVCHYGCLDHRRIWTCCGRKREYENSGIARAIGCISSDHRPPPVLINPQEWTEIRIPYSIYAVLNPRPRVWYSIERTYPRSETINFDLSYVVIKTCEHPSNGDIAK